MSDARVDLIRRLYELWEDRDLEAAFRDYLHPDFVIRIPEGYPEGGEVFRGREGFQNWMAMIDDVWSEWGYEDHRYLDQGEAVVAVLRVVAEGLTSGLRLEREVAHVWRFSEGRAASVTVYLDPDQAFEATRVAGGGVTADDR